MKRFLIAGTSSGCGKTTITCAILKALCMRGIKAASFKCGPDYIDPMFHKKIIGTEAYNLDSFFCDDNTMKYLLYKNSKNCDIAVIEGVMGFYDGADGRGSAYSVSEITDTPVVMVVDCKGMSNSIGAMMSGFLNYRKPNKIIGFIFNRLPARLASFAEKLCRELGTEYFGYIPTSSTVIESRRLGLVTADEVTDIKTKMTEWGRLANEYILIDKLISAAERPFSEFRPLPLKRLYDDNSPVIAVARDNAFCFMYSDNIALLEELGCRIEYFSPLTDKRLPSGASGLILSGGYPELYAEQLAANTEMLSEIKRHINHGIPTIAECGGFMYLHTSIEAENGQKHKMVNVINAEAYKTDRLQRFGYVTMTAADNNLLCDKSDKIAAHEFHYWDSTDCGCGFTAKKADGRSWNCCFCTETMYAGYPHIYFYSDIRIAERFVRACAAYGGNNEKDK